MQNQYHEIIWAKWSLLQHALRAEGVKSAFFFDGDVLYQRVEGDGLHGLIRSPRILFAGDRPAFWPPHLLASVTFHAQLGRRWAAPTSFVPGARCGPVRSP